MLRVFDRMEIDHKLIIKVDISVILDVKKKHYTFGKSLATVGGQMSGTAGRMFFCQKGKPLTISRG